MRRVLTVAIALSVLSTAAASPLWDGAVELWGRYDDLVPGYMQILFVQYNGGGDLVSTDESEIRIFVDETGEIQSHIVFARKDGEDVTAERREDPSGGAPPFGGGPPDDEDDDGGGFAGLQRSPFDPAEQANLAYTDTGRVEWVDGRRTRRFEFEHQTARNSRNVGTAWLAVSDGEPVRVELTIDPLPAFVNEFAMVQGFTRDDDDRLIVDELEFSGRAGFLFFTRVIESRLVFSEYFPSP
ncbi:MAG: hypothetical protein ACOC0O_03725 [Spirochaetota bacterium]